MRRYRLSEEKQAMLENMPQPLAVYQFIEGRVVTLALSDGFLSLFGYKDRAKAYLDMDKDMYLYDHPDDIPRISDAAIRFATLDEPYNVVYRSKTQDGAGYRIIHANGTHVYTEDGVRLAYVWYLDEGIYTEEADDQEDAFRQSLNNALHEGSLLRASKYDTLTGLPAMSWFFQTAREKKDAIIKAGGDAVLLYFDMNGMKLFNSGYGFSEGDKLLQSFARLLIRSFDSESCCHIGGDHFAVITEEEGVEDTLRALLEECREINNGNALTVRVGIYSSALENVPVSMACDRAKLACDTLKNIYQSGFQYFDHHMREVAVRREYILSNLDQALEERWIQVYYQPIVRSINRKMCDEEALARWIDPEEGLLPPGEFIPFLEEAGLLYKLDLYVLERVLEKITSLKEAGLYVVPQSVNLSRTDFSACDIVEEVRRRVDDAGVSRSLITIEITESTIGKDFNFMKAQIERFQRLGFPVWMDDFGSGYSSLEVLQEIRFNLVKFDMSFMRRLDEGDDRKILLTELMRMTNMLDIDTVCEGVETKEQSDFLREIGCSKQQGFYFQKPSPLDVVTEWYHKSGKIGVDNPDEADYYEFVGRVNLYDLAVIANENETIFRNNFNTLPMGIMELTKGSAQFVRNNQSYRDFMKRFFDMDLSDSSILFEDIEEGPGAPFITHVRECSITGKPAFYDEKLPDGTLIHSFARRIAANPITGRTAVAVSVLSITNAMYGTNMS